MRGDCAASEDMPGPEGVQGTGRQSGDGTHLDGTTRGDRRWCQASGGLPDAQDSSCYEERPEASVSEGEREKGRRNHAQCREQLLGQPVLDRSLHGCDTTVVEEADEGSPDGREEHILRSRRTGQRCSRDGERRVRERARRSARLEESEVEHILDVDNRAEGWHVLYAGYDGDGLVNGRLKGGAGSVAECEGERRDARPGRRLLSTSGGLRPFLDSRRLRPAPGPIDYRTPRTDAAGGDETTERRHRPVDSARLRYVGLWRRRWWGKTQ